MLFHRMLHPAALGRIFFRTSPKSCALLSKPALSVALAEPAADRERGPSCCTDLMAPTLAFLEHYASCRQQAPVSPLAAFVTFKLSNDVSASGSARSVAREDNPRIVASTDDASVLAGIATDLCAQRVNMQWRDHKTQVPFLQVDAAGKWLFDHAPWNNPVGYAQALNHEPEALAAKVSYIVGRADVLTRLHHLHRSTTRAQQDSGASFAPSSWPALPSLFGRTVLYGGSFDPPHMGHAIACTHLLAARGADSVWLIPSFKHAEKRGLAPFEHRFAMCELMAQGFGDKVMVCDTEAVLGGVANSVELTDHLVARYPERNFVFAIGSDLVNCAPEWGGWQGIVDAMPIEVLPRGGYTEHSVMPPVSSSAIRRDLARGLVVDARMPAGVAAYMREHALYPALHERAEVARMSLSRAS